MRRGPATRVLSRSQIQRLETFRRSAHDGAEHGYSFPQLRQAMSCQFSWETLKKALEGKPVRDLYALYIIQWLDRYLPAAAVFDGKAAAAGRDSETEPPESGITSEAEIDAPGAPGDDSDGSKRGSR